ncbi:hypothetical protein A2U01_0086518, partial [Trifolium medium]|nr:hypothetical protein [Trifolium medium]
SISLRRFAVLLKLCKADNQPRRPQDKTALFDTEPINYCTVMIGEGTPS